MSIVSAPFDLIEAESVKEQGKLQAEMEDVAALQRETDRKAELVKSISAQRVTAGASGVTLQGSPLSVIEQQVRTEAKDTARDRFNTAVAKQSAIYRSLNKSGALKFGAVMKAGQTIVGGM